MSVTKIRNNSNDKEYYDNFRYTFNINDDYKWYNQHIDRINLRIYHKLWTEWHCQSISASYGTTKELNTITITK